MSTHSGTTASSTGSTGLDGPRSGFAGSNSAGPANPAGSRIAGSVSRSAHSTHSTHSVRAAEFAGPAGPAGPMDLDIAVTEDRRRGIIARLLGRSRIPPVRFFTVHVDHEDLAFVLGRVQDHFRATPTLRRAASVLHLNRAYREHALGNTDDQGNPRHDVDDGRSHGPACADAQTSPVPTLLTYPSPDHVPVDDGAQPDLTMQSNIPTIPSESPGWSPMNRSAHTGWISTRSLTRSTPIPSGLYSQLRGTGLSRPSEPPTGLPAGLLLAPDDSGPSTHGLGRARGDGQQPPNSPTDHRNASGTETGQRRLQTASGGDTPSQGAAASWFRATDAQPPALSDINPHPEVNDAVPAVVQAAYPGQEAELTYLSFSETKVKENGLFVERKLLIRVGTKFQLKDSLTEPFSKGLHKACTAGKAREDELTQLSVECHQYRIRGGAYSGGDVLERIFLDLRPILRRFLEVDVIFKEKDGSTNNAGASEIQSLIAGEFSHLSRVRLEGKTTTTRLLTFPLQNLRTLEVLTSLTEADCLRLLDLCSERLDVLVAGPIDRVNEDCLAEHSWESTGGRSSPHVYPSTMRISSPLPCKQLLADIPSDLVDLHFRLTDAHGFVDVQSIFDDKGQACQWTLHLI
uniref:Uncharacterized protein n=2 Tax=Schizophyllum commune (strain H4-8 / FGSC 9210) TaxID=578458 RepID=D8PM09_SCHCM